MEPPETARPRRPRTITLMSGLTVDLVDVIVAFPRFTTVVSRERTITGETIKRPLARPTLPRDLAAEAARRLITLPAEPRPGE